MNAMLGLLRLDDSSWERLARRSMPSAAATVIGTHLLLAWNRFGLQGVLSPRPMVRMVLIGFYSWLALIAAVFLIAKLLRVKLSVESLAAVSGAAHFPMMILGVVLFVAVGLLQFLGPGMVSAVFVFGFWMPAMLVAGIGRVADTSLGFALLIILAPYGVWFGLTGRFLLDQLGHLL